MKIVSLLPAATDIVCHLGLGDQIVGVSHACLPMLGETSIPVLTRSRVPLDADARTIDECVRSLLEEGESLFELDEDALLALKPDVLLTQSLCNVCAIDGSQLEHVANRLGSQTKLFEWSPTRLDDVIQGIEQIGIAINAASTGRTKAAKMRDDVAAIRKQASLRTYTPTVVFLEWLNPLFCAGHWIPDLIDAAGGRELVGVAGAHSKAIEPSDLIAADPDVIIACCCGWSAQRTRAEANSLLESSWWNGLRAVRSGNVHILDAETELTTPGPRLADSCRRIEGILNDAVTSRSIEMSFAMRDDMAVA
jgi:iron complex transport system substrate-binding protein